MRCDGNLRLNSAGSDVRVCQISFIHRVKNFYAQRLTQGFTVCLSFTLFIKCSTWLLFETEAKKLLLPTKTWKCEKCPLYFVQPPTRAEQYEDITSTTVENSRFCQYILDMGNFFIELGFIS